jgi:mannose-1-phosphate guanylyltransferase
MRAVVLVGGFGTRLRPLTAAVPKQMLPVVDRPMIERVVSHLGAHGVTDAILSLGYRPDAFMDAYPDDRCDGVRLHYAVEPEPLDTAGAIRFAADAAGIDGRFIVVNGDVLTDLDVTQLWEHHVGSGAEATITLTPVTDPSRYGVVPIDGPGPFGRVEAFIEKPPPGEAPTNWINAGTYVLETAVLARIPAGRPSSIERATFPALVEDGALFAFQADTYWVDAGTPASYLQAQLDLVDGTRGDEAAVATDTSVDSSAQVEHSVVMAGASVGPGAVVTDSVLLPGAEVHADATVAGSIVGPAACVGSGAGVRGLCVLGNGAVVADGEQIEGVTRPEPEG